MPTVRHRALLARDGVFNMRDLGGIPVDGGSVAPRRVFRGDALHRVKGSVDVLHDLGVVRVLDLRDEAERREEGVLTADGIDVDHHPVIDPRYEWQEGPDGRDTLLRDAYREILLSFGPRLATALTAIADTGPDTGRGVAYHCAVGKDRTGLLTALLLGALGADDDSIVEDYVRSANVTAIQVAWLWSFGHPAGQVDDEELTHGLWSARPDTMRATLDWIRAEFGGVTGYLADVGVPGDVVEELRARLVVAANHSGSVDPVPLEDPDAVGR